VYELVEKIPPGSVATYGQIALMLGHPRSARAVGFAMSGAPKERGLPCHRVLNQRGELSPEHVFGGRGVQRMLLEAEGISFLRDGRVDLRRHLWKPCV